MTTPEQKLASLGFTLQTPVAPVANYVSTVQVGCILIISGQLPLVNGKIYAPGTLGVSVSIEEATKAAQYSFLNMISQVKAAIGELSHVKKIVRLGGFIASAPDFYQQAAVINGASDMAVAVFGNKGRHSRSAVGVASLPLGASVEVEGMLEIE